MKTILFATIIASAVQASQEAYAGAAVGIEVAYQTATNARRIDEGTDVKFDSPECPSGFRVVAGGHRILSVDTGDSDKIFVWWSWPDKNQNLWSTHVRNSATPVGGTAPLVEVEVTAVCVESSN